MNMSIDFAFTVDDIAYDGYSTETHLNNLLDFCDELGLKATLFAVPIVKGNNLNKRNGYVSILRDAIARGHEVAQHGLTHDRFEVGIPPAMILDLPHERKSKEYLNNNRKKIEDSHSVEKIRGVLRKGRLIIEDAIGRKVEGFRAPALQVCDNLFTALEEEGYLYDSSTYYQEAAWRVTIDRPSDPVAITRESFIQRQISKSMREIPLTAEYTMYLRQEKFDAYFHLITHDAEACAKAEIPFVTLSHVSPIQEGDEGLGFKFYRDFLSRSRERNHDIHFFTLSEIARKNSKDVS